MVRKRAHRFKLLLDEMLPHRDKFPELNNLHNLRHISDDFKMHGSKDIELVRLAKQQGRIIVSKNIKHFRWICKSNLVDLISLDDSTSFERIDNRICAYLRRRRNLRMTGIEKKI